MNELARTPAMIATEINVIKQQVQTTMAYAAIEIGKRLTEAKGLVAHGEWRSWLEKNVEYSERSAQTFMQLAHEYGSGHAVANLSYSKAVALLPLSAEDRTGLMESHDVEGMSSRELQALVKKLQQEKAEMQRTMDDMLSVEGPEREKEKAEMDKLRRGIEAAKAIKSEDEKDKQSLREQLQEANARNIEDAQRANDEIASLKAQLKEAGQPIIQQVMPPDTEAEMARLRAQAARGQAEERLRALRDMLWDCWKQMMAALETLESAGGDPEGRYRAGVRKLTQMMGAQAEGKKVAGNE